MKLPTQKWLFILGFLVLLLFGAVGILTYKLINEQERSQALEAAVEIMETDFEAMIQENIWISDSLQAAKEERDKIIASRGAKIEDLLAHIDSLLNSTSSYEKDIDSMRDLDSIRDLFSKYYPDKPAPGEGSY